MLTDDERRELMRLCAGIIGNRAVKIAHVGAISADTASGLAKYADELGYDAVSAVVPFYYGFDTDEIISYYRQIADASPLGVLVYNIPAATGVSLGLRELERFYGGGKFHRRLSTRRRRCSGARGDKVPLAGEDRCSTAMMRCCSRVSAAGADAADRVDLQFHG